MRFILPGFRYLIQIGVYAAQTQIIFLVCICTHRSISFTCDVKAGRKKKRNYHVTNKDHCFFSDNYKLERIS